MKYAPPIGQEAQGENAHYIDGNPELGILGSPVPAVALEAGQRELVHVIRQAGLPPSAEDLTQLYQAICKIIGVQVPLATLTTPGMVRPDGTTITVDGDGTIHDMEAEPVVSDADNRVPTSGAVREYVEEAVREYVPPAAARAAMPGKKYITVSLPSSGGTLTAPADGYISWGMEPSSMSESSTLSCTVTHGDAVYRRRMTTHNYWATPMGLVFPVTAGDVVTLIYERVSTKDTRLQFIYANGALSEGDLS